MIRDAHDALRAVVDAGERGDLAPLPWDDLAVLSHLIEQAGPHVEAARTAAAAREFAEQEVPE